MSRNEKVPEKLLKKFSPANFKNSLFISFEGIEGAGKTTQIKILESKLQEQGFNVLVLREPGGTSFGEKLRLAMLNAERPVSTLAQAHLFASSRAQLLSEKTIKALEEGNSVVIYDRYIDSSLVYQGKAGALSYQTVLEIHAHHPLTIMPNITFYLKIPVELSLKRQSQRGQGKDYFESQKEQFYRSLYDGHEELAAIFPDRIKSIDATRGIDEIAQEIASIIREAIR